MASKTVETDLQEIVTDQNILWDTLKNSTILITGATGLLGSALVQALAAANNAHQLNIHLIACGRNKDLGGLLSAKTNAKFICGDIRNNSLFSHLEENVDFIFHCAAITKSADMVLHPVDVLTTSVDGTRNILELALRRNCKSLVYLSSMEVYGQGIEGEVEESDLGYISLSNIRSSYPESKRFCEMLCVSYAKEYNIPVKIARLAQTFGAGTPIKDTRVFTQFARSAIDGKNIILHTQGNSQGNYCYTSDAVRGLLTLLLKGEDGEAYNIANPTASMTIREMAERVCETLGGNKTKVVIDIPKDAKKLGYAPIVKYILSVDKIAALGWQPRYGLTDMYQRMVSEW